MATHQQVLIAKAVVEQRTEPVVLAQYGLDPALPYVRLDHSKALWLFIQPPLPTKEASDG